MNAVGCPRLVSLACGLALVLSAGAVLLLFGAPATGAPPVASAGAADQVQPDRRISRLGQLYEEHHKLLADYRTAESTLKGLEESRIAATTVYGMANQQLQTVVRSEVQSRNLLNATPPGARVGSRDGPSMAEGYRRQLAQLTVQETGLRHQIDSAQRIIAQWTAANERVTQLSQTMQSDLPKKREEWLWLCDPFGKLGARVHRASIDFFSQQIAQDREFALSHLGRGFACLHTEQCVEALRDFSKAALLDKDLADVAAATRGWSYGRMQRDSEAATQFHTARQLSPTSPFIELILGHYYAEGRNDKFAKDHFQNAVNLGGDLPQAHEALAFFLATRCRGDLASAKQAIQQATKACEITDWSQWVYLDTLAVACAAAGDFQLAEQWEAKALERAPHQYQTELQKRRELYASKRADAGQSSKAADTIAAEGGTSRPGGTPPGTTGDGKRPFSQFGLSRLQCATPADEARYVASIREALDIGLGPSSDDLERTRHRCHCALFLCSNDPRLFYAWGLVCLKRGNLTEAQQQFETATGLAEGRYLPAWQALVRTQILQGTADLAIQTLVRLADAFQLPENRSLLPEEKEKCANWLGRVITFIDGNTADPSMPGGSVKEADARLSEILDPSLRAAYQDGKRRSPQRQQAQQDLEMLGQKQMQVQDAKAKLEKDGERLAQTRDDKLRQIQDVRNALEFRIAQLQAQAQALLDRAQRTGFLPSQYDRIAVEIDNIQRKQIRPLNQAANGVGAEFDKQMRDLNKEKERLDKLERDIMRAQGFHRGTAAASRPKAKSAAGVEAALDSLLPFDYRAEAERIVASYSPQKAPQATPNGPAQNR